MNPYVGVVAAATVLLNAAFYGVRILASYRALALGGDASTVGIITAAFALLPLLVALPLGRVINTGRVRTVFLGGGAATALGCGLLALSTSTLTMALAVAVVGTGQLGATLAAQGWMAAQGGTSGQRLDNSFAIFAICVSLGQTAGAPLAAALTRTGAEGAVETDTALLAFAGIALATLALIACLRDPVRPRAMAPEERLPVLAILRTRGMAPALLCSLVVLSAIDITTSYLPLIAEKHGISVAAVAFLVSVRTLASAASRGLMPLLRRIGTRRSWLLAATGLSAPLVVAMAYISEVWILAAISVALGILWGMSQPISMTWVVQLVPAQMRGTVLSLRLTGNRLGQVAVPSAAGLIAGVGGLGAVFVLTGMLLGITTAVTALDRSGGGAD